MRTGILSFTSDENNVQLISMRALSGLWDWVALDEMKQVNLRLPDERVQHTYLGYVPYPLASLPADETRRVLKGVSLEAFGFARDEQNMIGQVFFEDRQTGRSPSAANIDTQPLAKVPMITSNSPIERLEQLCLRHPLPAIVFADRKPQGGVIQVCDTATALGFDQPLFLAIEGCQQASDDTVILTGYFHIPAPDIATGDLWSHVTQNST